MRLDPSESALILVDYQERLMPSIYQGEQVLAQAYALAQLARALAVPVIGTEQNPAGLGSTPASLKVLCDHTLSKMHFDACADGLLEVLQASGRRHWVVAGCEAHVCLMQTVLGLKAAAQAWVGAKGEALSVDSAEGTRKLAVVTSACSSRRASDRELGLTRLQAAGLPLYSFEMLAFEWLGSAQHPAFKSVLPLIKAQPL